MPTRSIIISANVAVRINFPDRLVSVSFLYAASMIAPAAPKAAAGVGLVIPPKIEPKTATMRTSGGKTTLKISLSASREIAVFDEYKTNITGIVKSAHVIDAEASGLIKTISDSNKSTVPKAPTTKSL